ncbi:MAG: hypothetical protein WBB89_13660 [Candidatus Acidiferrum sp.]
MAHRNWDEAIKRLRRGDHYLLVMWDVSPRSEWSVVYFLKILAGSLGVIFLMFLVILAKEELEPQWKRIQKYIPTLPSPNPHVLFGILIAIVLAGFFFPRRVGNAVGWVMDRTLFRLLGPKEDEEDSE